MTQDKNRRKRYSLAWYNPSVLASYLKSIWRPKRIIFPPEGAMDPDGTFDVPSSYRKIKDQNYEQNRI